MPNEKRPYPIDGTCSVGKRNSVQLCTKQTMCEHLCVTLLHIHILHTVFVIYDKTPDGTKVEERKVDK